MRVVDARHRKPLIAQGLPSRAGDRGRTGDVQLGKLSRALWGKGFSAAPAKQDNAILRRGGQLSDLAVRVCGGNPLCAPGSYTGRGRKYPSGPGKEQFPFHDLREVRLHDATVPSPRCGGVLGAGRELRGVRPGTAVEVEPDVGEAEPASVRRAAKPARDAQGAVLWHFPERRPGGCVRSRAPPLARGRCRHPRPGRCRPLCCGILP